MAYLINRRFLWHTSAAGLVIFDYFLFSTGNPSITYSFLGGWFGITLFVALGVTASYASKTILIGAEKLHFALYISSLIVLSLGLLAASPYASRLANLHMQHEVGSFVEDPINSKAEVSNNERQLMIEIKKKGFTIQRDSFIPTFRRIDYLFRTKEGETYLLVMEMRWNGTPVISLLRD